MSDSKFLRKDDFPQHALLTIQSFAQDNVAMQGQPEEKKWICFFAETDKGLVLNSTNLQLLEVATGCTSTEDAIGKKIVLYNDPSISFGGRLTGGIRIRAPRIPQAAPTHGIMGKPANRPAPAPALPAPVEQTQAELPPGSEEGDSEVPF